MPVGMQLIGDTFTEDKLVKVAYAFQKETVFTLKKEVEHNELRNSNGS